MSRIKVLDAITANNMQLAKLWNDRLRGELCENALDAGADVITVVIKKRWDSPYPGIRQQLRYGLTML